MAANTAALIMTLVPRLVFGWTERDGELESAIMRTLWLSVSTDAGWLRVTARVTDAPGLEVCWELSRTPPR